MRAACCFALLAALVAVPPDEPSPSSCLIQPDKTVAVRPAPGRTVYCGLDLGSRSVRLSVVSMAPGRTTTVKEERQCKRTLGMGALVFDSTTSTARPLPDAAIGYLSDTIQEFQRICTTDAGTVVAAGATQWARDATNIRDVVDRVKNKTGVSINVLTPVQEAEYSYVAAAAGAPGRIVLDPGSNSFEIAWQPARGGAITSVLVKYGYVRGAVNDFEAAADFAAARAAYQAKAKAQIEEALAALTPVMSFASLRGLVRSGTIGPEIVTLGTDGGAVDLAARGRLRTADGRWVATAAALDDVLRRATPVVDASFGVMAGAPLVPADVTGFFASIRPADFTVLTTEPVRSLYGQRVLAVPALVDLLFRELGASRLIVVPQESAVGNILAHLPR